MRRLTLAISLIAGIFGNRPGVAQEVHSLHPMFQEKDPVLMPQIMGSWRALDWGLTLSLSAAGDNFYTLVDSEGETASKFEAAFVRLGNALWLDVMPVYSNQHETGFALEHRVVSHSFFLVRLKNDTLSCAGMNYRWFLKEIKKERIAIPHSWYGKMLLLTGTPDEMKELVSAHYRESGFCDAPIQFYRQSNASSFTESQDKINMASEAAAPNISGLSGSSCKPAFPIIDGWLGGDGDLSVALSPTKTLWIFSDTYVGGRDDQTRQHAGMVSSTIGVSTCDSGNNWSIKYYWRNQYTDHPEPIFGSHTDRYLYWPNEAFMVEDTLFVILHKIGTKEGGDPEDMFNFLPMGMALAKVLNVRNATPDHWNIQLIPWSSVFDPNTCNAAITRDSTYLYAFMGREAQKAYLTRLRLDKLEEPAGNIEYFSRAGVWKRGLRPDDSKILIRDLIGGSVRYHADVKLWIMVYGPNLFSNKILLRTAPEITGPWSEARTVYECPEPVPLDKVDPKDCACYCAREHPQFYDPATQTLVVTYDCNGRKASEAMNLYIPRVLRVSLKGLVPAR